MWCLQRQAYRGISTYPIVFRSISELSNEEELRPMFQVSVVQFEFKQERISLTLSREIGLLNNLSGPPIAVASSV